jgi:hypothetical protein
VPRSVSENRVPGLIEINDRAMPLATADNN